MQHSFLFIFGVLSNLDISSEFNLDVTNPIIISNSFNGPRSQFGASVTLVTGSNPSPSSWIIIGAPKANSTNPNLSGIVEPGILWRCSLGRDLDTCQVLEVYSHGNTVQDYQGGQVHNRKDGSMLGVTSYLGDSNRFVSCAPRWSNQKAVIGSGDRYKHHYFMNGACYWRPKYHIIQDEVPPLLSNHTLIPLRDKERQSNSMAESEYFDWSFGEAGFSMHITSENELILGAPGVADWRGSVIRLSDNKSHPRLSRNGRDEEYGEIFQAPSQISRPSVDPKLKAKQTSYFGYAVTSGKYFSTTKLTQFAAGVPRGGLIHSLTGHVSIFTFPEGSNSQLTSLLEIDSPVGIGIGSYFGSVLCTSDLNNDGFDDLLVGAPRFSTKTQKLRTAGPQLLLRNITAKNAGSSSDFSGAGDEGAVFVYLSNGKIMTKTVSIGGRNQPWSHFGSAITSLGDINRDGFSDIAVGAPREDSNRGAVYIYHGGKSEKIMYWKYSQVIFAKDLDSSLVGFGYSLSLGIDIDNNQFNDLAIGAYSSAKTVVLRSKPVVTLIGTMTKDISKLPLGLPDFTFNFTSCVSYDGHHPPSTLRIRVHLLADADFKLGRVRIKIPGVGNNSISSYSYTVEALLSSKICDTFEAIVWTRLTLSTQAVTIRQTISLEEEGKPNLILPTQYDIQPKSFESENSRLNVSGPGFSSFCKMCPVRNLNVGNQESLILPLEVACRDENACISRLSIEATFIGISENVFIMGSTPNVTLQVVVTNSEDPAFSPGLIVSWPKRNLVVLPSTCEVKVKGSNLSCSLGHILTKTVNEKREMSFTFDMSDLFPGEQNTPEEFIVTVEATTVSNVSEVAKVDKMLSIKSRADIWVSGSLERVYFYQSNPVQIFSHKYNITLEGPSTLGRVELLFDIPLAILSGSNSETLLNVTSILAQYDGQPCRTSTSCTCSITTSTGLPLFLHDASQFITGSDPDLDGLSNGAYSAEKVGRDLRKREIDSTVAGLEDTKTTIRPTLRPKHENKFRIKNGVLDIDCANEFVECAKVICLINKFRPNAVATVEVSMKASTDDTRKLLNKHTVDAVRILSHGEARILEAPKDLQPVKHKPDTFDSSTTISQNEAGIPEWAYTASVVGGLLILACITLCLIATGVFEKKKPETDQVTDQVPEQVPLRVTSIEEEDEALDEVFRKNSKDVN